MRSAIRLTVVCCTNSTHLLFPFAENSSFSTYVSSGDGRRIASAWRHVNPVIVTKSYTDPSNFRADNVPLFDCRLFEYLTGTIRLQSFVRRAMSVFRACCIGLPSARKLQLTKTESQPTSNIVGWVVHTMTDEAGS